MKQAFSILREDIGGDYLDYYNCSFAKAFKRQFPEKGEIWVTTNEVFIGPLSRSEGTIIAMIDNKFSPYNHYSLQDDGIEFHTQIEIYES